MNFEEQLKALIYFHLQEHDSARHLLQDMKENDFARQNIAPEERNSQTDEQHTWGGKMWPHPHVHYITTAGGINSAGKWVTLKNDKTFLFPVLALSNVFRAKFLEGIRKLHDKGQLTFPGELGFLADPTKRMGGNWLGEISMDDAIAQIKTKKNKAQP